MKGSCQRGTMATIHELDSGRTEEYQNMSFYNKVIRKSKSGKTLLEDLKYINNQ